MTTYAGHGGVIKKDDVVIAEVTDWNYTPTVASRNTTTLDSGGSVRRQADGLSDGTGSLTFLYDFGNAGQQAIYEGADVTLKVYPAGEASGYQFFTIPAVFTSNDHSGGVNTETLAVTASFEGNGAMTRGNLA